MPATNRTEPVASRLMYRAMAGVACRPRSRTCHTAKVVVLVAVILPPGDNDRNGFIRADGDGVNGTVHPAQMTELAVGRILDERLFGPRVLTNDIRGAGPDACSAADAPLDALYGHDGSSLRIPEPGFCGGWRCSLHPGTGLAGGC